MKTQQVLARLDKSWKDFEESYRGLSGAQQLVPGVTGGWSVRDIIAHVTWWEEEALTHMPVIREGGSSPRYSVTFGGINAFNAMMTERRKGLSLFEVLRQHDEGTTTSTSTWCASYSYSRGVTRRPLSSPSGTDRRESQRAHRPR